MLFDRRLEAHLAAWYALQQAADASGDYQEEGRKVSELVMRAQMLGPEALADTVMLVDLEVRGLRLGEAAQSLLGDVATATRDLIEEHLAYYWMQMEWDLVPAPLKVRARRWLRRRRGRELPSDPNRYWRSGGTGLGQPVLIRERERD